MATATNTIGSQVGSLAETMKNKASETASNVADKARQAASNLGSNIGNKAEDATHAVGAGMKSLADTIRDRGPHEGMVGSATSTLASGLESGGQYLQQQGIKGVADDLTQLIRRNPIPALLLGVGLGFVVARATMRR
jgi:hypothetical protein